MADELDWTMLDRSGLSLLSLSPPVSSLHSPLRKSPLTLEDFKFLAVLGRGVGKGVSRQRAAGALAAASQGGRGTCAEGLGLYGVASPDPP